MPMSLTRSSDDILLSGTSANESTLFKILNFGLGDEGAAVISYGAYRKSIQVARINSHSLLRADIKVVIALKFLPLSSPI